jgi:D-alanyl-D-alanine carboxypeptidase
LAAAAVTAALMLGTALPAHAATHHKHKAASQRSSNQPPVGVHPIYESIVVDATTGRVLHQVNADTRSYPASLTKMMTLYMLFDALQKGKIHLDTPIRVSAHAASMAPSKLDLAPGSTIATEQAIYAIVTKSANDVAVAIAEHLGGTEEHFCEMMTARAHAIGMTRTHFADASGLPNKAQLSTARDMAILGKRLMTEFPQYFPYFSRTEFPYNGTMIRTHNHLLENYDGADGIKTGYTAASGFNLVASARRGNARLITVVFGGASAKLRDQHVAALMDAGFKVLSTDPQAVANAQTLDPFPSTPPETDVADAAGAREEGVTAVPAVQPVNIAALSTPPQVQELAAGQSAGDIDDAIGQKLAAVEPAPPLAITPALVPAPGVVGATKRQPKAAAAAMAPPAANNTWGIQVGAYANRTVAANKAEEARDKVQSKYTDASVRVVPVKSKHGVLYRAQVVGLARGEVTKACHLAAKVMHGCHTVSPDTTRVAMDAPRSGHRTQ